MGFPTATESKDGRCRNSGELKNHIELRKYNFQSRPNIIHSQGKALADRSVLYKYMNPNLIAVLTESTETENTELMATTLYVLDGVTGSVVHTAQHKEPILNFTAPI